MRLGEFVENLVSFADKRPALVPECLLEERFGGGCIALSAEPKVDGLATLVHGTRRILVWARCRPCPAIISTRSECRTANSSSMLLSSLTALRWFSQKTPSSDRLPLFAPEPSWPPLSSEDKDRRSGDKPLAKTWKTRCTRDRILRHKRQTRIGYVFRRAERNRAAR